MFVSQPTFSYQIKLLEEEIGFAIFERSGKGAALTPAGAQFVAALAGLREDLKRAIEQGQNFSAKYTDSISISLMVFQAVYFLPEAMRAFGETHPEVHHECLAESHNFCIALAVWIEVRTAGETNSTCRGQGKTKGFI